MWEMVMNTDSQSFLLLMNWMSPAFPTGSFAYSHGLEWAIASGQVHSADDVENWIADLLATGSGWNDAVLFAQCWNEDEAMLNELALALAGSQERYLETTQLGRNFSIAATIWTNVAQADSDIAYPVAAGLACKAMHVPQEFGILAYVQGFSAALVSVAVRLVPLGQTKGMQVLRNLMPVITTVATRALVACLDDLGSNTVAADIAAIKHETQHSRIFRT
jgi:urease accessory protein